MKLLQLLPGVGALLRGESSVGVDAKGFLFDYAHHGDDWHGGCKGPLPQSPIDFAKVHYRIPPAGKFAYQYAPLKSQFEFLNNGHALFADIGGRELGVDSTFLQSAARRQEVLPSAGSGAAGGAGRSGQLGFNRMLEMFFRAAFPKVGASTVIAATSVDQLDLNEWLRGTFFEYQGTTTVP